MGEHTITVKTGHAGAYAAPPEGWIYLQRVAAAVGIHARGVHARLTLLDTRPRPLLIAQANTRLGGRPVRAQITAHGAADAQMMLALRLRDQLARAAAPWTPRPWPPIAERRPAVEAPVARPQLARIKTYPLITSTPAQAALFLDAMDYDIHLFADPDTGRPAALQHAAPTGYTLTRLHSARPHTPARCRSPMRCAPPHA